MCIFVCESREVQKDYIFENWNFEPFKNCLFLHFASQWLTTHDSRAYSQNMQKHRANFRKSSLSCKALAKDSQNSLPEIFKKLNFLRISQLWATRKSTHEKAKNWVFQH